MFLPRGGQINRLLINRPITDINRTDIIVTDSYWSVSVKKFIPISLSVGNRSVKNLLSVNRYDR
jgi:hypothetical protein